MDRYSGVERWIFDSKVRDTFSPSNTLVRRGRVLYGGSDTSIHALNATTGQELWIHRLFAGFEELATFSGSFGYSGSLDYDPVHDVVFVGTMKNYTVALDATTGREIWRFTVRWF